MKNKDRHFTGKSRSKEIKYGNYKRKAPPYAMDGLQYFRFKWSGSMMEISCCPVEELVQVPISK